jgi:hypothetical protein
LFSKSRARRHVMTLLASTMGAWAAALVLSAGPAKMERAEVLKQQSEQLAREARALANTSGCEKVEECEVAGFGHKSCGGPREYIAYCAKTTDVKALQSKLAELEKAEQAWQTEAGIVSNCSLTRRPPPRLEEGMCRTR